MDRYNKHSLSTFHQPVTRVQIFALRHCTTNQAHIHITPACTLTLFGSLLPPDPRHSKLTPWERNHRIIRGKKAKERD